MTEKAKPVFEARVRQIHVSTFLNQSKKGRTFYNTHLVRRYTTESGDWMSSSSFTGEADLLIARDLIDRALNFIRTQEVENKEEVANG